jgi:hypothetical protein
MFVLADLQTLLWARPFVPFRLHRSDGGMIEVKHREFVTAGRRYAVVGISDPTDPDAPFDRHAVVWYMHVTRVEMLDAGPPPMSASPGGPAEAPSPART